MKKLNIIGCGNVGKTLAHLWSKQKIFTIGDIVNQSTESNLAAIQFIGSGQTASSVSAMHPAEVYLIGTPDDQIIESCNELASCGLLRKGDTVFHCSGALPSSSLNSAKQASAGIASVHPVKSFANPVASSTSFEGTYCGVEGDKNSLDILSSAFEAIGGKTFDIDPQFKTLYHAGSVMVCNYLTSLIEVGTQSYLKAGLDKETSLKVMEPIVRGTIDNIFSTNTVSALTGPIARGDHATVSRQLTALFDWNPEYGELYRNLGNVALELSRLQGSASPDSLAMLAEILDPAHIQKPDL